MEGAIYGFLRLGCRCPFPLGHAGCESFSVQVTSDAMDQRGTILPIAPDYVWPGIALLGLLLAMGRIYWASTTIGKSGGAIPRITTRRRQVLDWANMARWRGDPCFPGATPVSSPRPDQRTFRWKVRRAVAGGRKPEGKGPSTCAGAGKSGRAWPGGRERACPRTGRRGRIWRGPNPARRGVQGQVAAGTDTG